MKQSFESMLLEGGHKNSLGRAEEVVQLVLADKTRLEELYHTMFSSDAWVRMRGADAFEKVCRNQAAWIEPFIDRLQRELGGSTQASILWHIAEIYPQVRLNQKQKDHALQWLTKQLATTDVDWIVAANCMKALREFVQRGDYDRTAFRELLMVQQHHHSKSVVRKATKLLEAVKQGSA